MLKHGDIVKKSSIKTTDELEKEHRQESESTIIASSSSENEITIYRYIQWSAHKNVLKF
jgi:hypothetical protein